MKITIARLLLAATLALAGCANSFARHDLFEESDRRVAHLLQAAQRVCRNNLERGPMPSAARYQGCVLDKLRESESRLVDAPKRP